MKRLDAREYISTLRDLINEGREVNMIVTGSSMSPFLCDERDTVYLRKPDHEPGKGDIVFYERDSGRFVLHRILHVHGDSYDMIGDNQTEIEYGIRRDQIFAYVYKVKRKGEWIEPGMFWWEFFSRIWIRMIPLRKTVSHLYGKSRKKNSENS